jgi:hypothetical protein
MNSGITSLLNTFLSEQSNGETKENDVQNADKDNVSTTAPEDTNLLPDALAAAVAPPSPPLSKKDLKKMKPPELRKKLKALGLSSQGPKKDLQTRLLKAVFP